MSNGWVLALAIASGCSAQSWNPQEELPHLRAKTSDLKQMLALICPGNEYVENGTGCHVCPDFTSSSGATEDARLWPVIEGHFEAPDSNDMLLVLYGCEPHANNFQNTLLFSKTPDGWSLARTTPNSPGTCHKIPDQKGRDGLVCFDQSMYDATSFGHLTFGYAGGENTQLLAVQDNTAQGCYYGPDVFVSAAVKEVKLARGKDGKLTLSIAANCGKYLKRCPEGNPEATGATAPPNAIRPYRIDYQFDGDTLRLAPASVAVKRAFDACLSFQ